MTLALAPVLVVGPAARQCESEWVPELGGRPGVSGTVQAQTIFDDGSGPSLYVAGEFTSAGGVAARNVARWDGAGWSRLGNGPDGPVSALATFDDGTGSALYAAGVFQVADGVVVNRVARWDGSAWSDLAGGTNFPGVSALAVFDDGSGPALFAGGAFTSAGGSPASRIARWDGASWAPLGSGTNGPVLALAVHDDGSGPALYAGGDFTLAGGVAANRIARWDGSGWSALGTGTNARVRALAEFDDGTGPALVAGGEFTGAGGGAAAFVAAWDGASWSALGGGVNSHVLALTVFDHGAGAALHAGGDFTLAGGAAANRIARWDGSAWSALAAGLEGSLTEARSLAEFDDGAGARLHAGGLFSSAGDVEASSLAAWDGTSWSPLTFGLSGGVECVAVLDDGDGPALYAAGWFTSAAGTPVGRVAKREGGTWTAFGEGIGPTRVNALETFDSGAGPALYAGGSFTTASGVTANRIARWNGASWVRVGLVIGGQGNGVNGTVEDLATHDDGLGAALFVAGAFTTAGFVTTTGIARWDGSTWSDVGGGLGSGAVALEVFDDGTGPALVVGGHFTSAGGTPANRIARWDGAVWSPLGSGTNAPVTDLVVHDDGNGPALYASGSFTTAGGTPVHQIARWNGASWESLGGLPVDSIECLASFDDGGGAALFAGALFTGQDGVLQRNLAKWDGTSWTFVQGFSGGLGGGLRALAGFDDGEATALYAGGDFHVSPAADSFLARRNGCLPSLAVDAIAPRAGPIGGGNTVRLSGAGFVAGTSVTFDGEAAAVTLVSPARLDVVVPAGRLTRPRSGPRPVDVVVTSPYGGTSRLPRGYTYGRL